MQVTRKRMKNKNHYCHGKDEDNNDHLNNEQVENHKSHEVDEEDWDRDCHGDGDYWSEKMVGNGFWARTISVTCFKRHCTTQRYNRPNSNVSVHGKRLRTTFREDRPRKHESSQSFK